MSYKVREIFRSLQGEGCHAGIPAVFVRFSGCNLHCPFCDTDHARGTPMTAAEIAARVHALPAPLIVLTGGEPALAIDAPLLEALRAPGRSIAIETNGTLPLPPGIDWVTVSPKQGIAGTPAPVHPSLVADEIKVVDLGQDLDQYFALPCRRPHTAMCLQPCWCADADRAAANVQRTLQRVLQDPRWRLSLQTHRLLNIP